LPDNKELVNMLRTVIQEELTPVRQELQQVNKRLDTLEAGQASLEAGQASLEAALNDLKTINRGTHKKIFTNLDAIWNDVKRIDNRLDVQEKKAIR